MELTKEEIELAVILAERYFDVEISRGDLDTEEEWQKLLEQDEKVEALLDKLKGS